jgi:hypothetical protein
MLASTMQFSRYGRSRATESPRAPHKYASSGDELRADNLAGPFGGKPVLTEGSA